MSPVDTLHTFETPEGVELGLRAAGPVPRALAYVLDFIIRIVVFMVVIFFASRLGQFGAGFGLLTAFLLEWFYPVFFELRSGQTPGKKALSLRVVNDNGTPVSPSASLIRNLLRVVDFFPLFYGTGLLASFIHPRFKRLGDMAAGTLVVYAEKEKVSKGIAAVKPQPIPVTLSLDENQAILDFAERAPSIAPARQQELAGLITGQESDAGVERVVAYANWLSR